MSISLLRKPSEVVEKRDGRFVVVIIGLFAFIPGIRRVLDFSTGSFGSIQILSLLPVLSLLLLISGVWRNRARLPDPFLKIGSAWLGLFAYGLAIGMVNAKAAAALYEASIYCLPIVCGAWVASTSHDVTRTLMRFNRIVICCATLTALYAIFQFISPPPWDVFWVVQAHFYSVNQPVPFGMRVFSTLNAPEPFGSFLAVAILMSIHQIYAKGLIYVLPLLCCVAALALTLVRSDWIALSITVPLYILLSGKAVRSVLPLAGTLAIVFAIVSLLPSLLGGTHGSLILDRIGTLSDVSNDESVRDRQEEAAEGIAHASAVIIGDGLGSVGTATKLADPNQEATLIDGGYLARFVEFGYFGLATYVWVVVWPALAGTVFLFSGTRPAGASRRAIVLCICIIILYAILDIGGDTHYLLNGIFFWVAVGALYGLVQGRRAGRETPAWAL